MRFSVWLLAASLSAVVAPVQSASAKDRAVPGTEAAAKAGKLSGRPDFGPPPAGVNFDPPPAPDPKLKDDAIAFLLSESSEQLRPDGLDNLVRYVVELRNQAGVQSFGTIAIPWNEERTRLTIHHVNIVRGGKTIEALDKADIQVLQREAKLEQSTFTGVKTVVMPIRGLAIGDRLDVAYSYATRPGGIGKREEIQTLEIPLTIGRMVRRFTIDPALNVHWKTSPDLADWNVADDPATHTRTYSKNGVEPPKLPKYVPDRFKTPMIQVTSYASWSEVADTLTDQFAKARRVDDSSPVAALARSIADKSSDPRVRLLAALRAVQNDVRYTALLLGSGDYVPTPASDVWANRYGDCKGKTALLLALLDRLGIAADPVLASIAYDDALPTILPTLSLLDHVYVRAKVGPDYYYLDGTQSGQLTLDELRTGTSRNVLPLVGHSSLVAIADIPPAQPLYETVVVWDARQSLLKDVPFEATLTFRGAVATAVRGSAAATLDREKFIGELKAKVAGVSNDILDYVSMEEADANGNFVAHFKGKGDLDWSSVEGMKGNRYQFSHSTVKWNVEFDRNDDKARYPVLLDYPYWERMTETLLLPSDGRGFVVDASSIDQTIAGTHISRSIVQNGNRVTATSNFRRLQREISAAASIAAGNILDDINGDFGYVVARKRIPGAD